MGDEYEAQKLIENDPDLKSELQSEQEEESKRKEADILYQSITGMEDFEAFKDQFNNYFVRYSVNGRKEIQEIGSEEFFDFMYGHLYNLVGRLPSVEAVKKVQQAIRSLITINKTGHDLYTRVATRGPSLLYDLANQNNEIVEVTREGWRVLQDNEITFRRISTQKEQASPVNTATIKDMSRIMKYINIPGSQQLLFVVYLVSCFMAGKFARPISVFAGEKGGAKSTMTRLINDLVDPTEADLLSVPKKEDDFAITLQKHWFAGFDNVSVISKEQSDWLCKGATGGALEKRKLYTDIGSIVCKFQSCISINGVTLPLEADDVLDRSLLFDIQRIEPEKRKKEEILWAEFSEDKPYILGAIFKIISKVLAVDEVQKLDKLTRLADFEAKGYIIAECIAPGNGNKFREQLKSNADKQNEEAVSNNDAARIVITVLRDLMKDGEITLYPKELFGKCEPYIKGKNFPKDETRLIKELNKMRSNLESEKVYFRKEDKDRGGIPYTFSTSPLPDKTKS